MEDSATVTDFTTKKFSFQFDRRKPIAPVAHRPLGPLGPRPQGSLGPRGLLQRDLWA